jgi:acyl carrier protein
MEDKMEINSFIRNVENALDNVDSGSLTAETKIHDLKQLDSLGVLSIIAMFHKQYQTKIKGSDIKAAITITDLFNLLPK